MQNGCGLNGMWVWLIMSIGLLNHRHIPMPMVCIVYVAFTEVVHVDYERVYRHAYSKC